MSDSYDLRRGDNDAERTWGGMVRGSEDHATLGQNRSNAVTGVAPVRDLQAALLRVGIRLGPEPPTGVFDITTEWALREFQIHARMDRVAKEDVQSPASEYIDRLSAVPTGKEKYAGPVSGVYNPGTRAALDHWIAADWRCPVVLDAWKAPKKGAPEERVARNVWRSGGDVKGGIVKATDFSGYYPTAVPQPWRLGTRVKYEFTRNGRTIIQRGPAATVNDAWASMEVLPEVLVGKPWAQLGAEDKSCYRVVRSVCNVESFGFFECGNAYDDGLHSSGIFHFIVSALGDGELAQVLDRFAAANGADYDRLVGAFGIDVRPTDRKTHAPRFKLQTERGSYEEPVFRSQVDKEVYTAELQYLRNWHVFYRVVMMQRTSESLRRRQWSEAIDRLRRVILPTRIDATIVTPLDAGAKPPRLSTIGDTFTSEMATAFVLRWHVNSPTNVVGSREELVDGKKTWIKVLGRGLVGALARAKADNPDLAWSEPPTKWTDKEEAAVIDAILFVASPKTVKETLPRVQAFPEEKKGIWTLDRGAVGALSRARGSFKLVSASAPTSPAPLVPGQAPTVPASPSPPPHKTKPPGSRPPRAPSRDEPGSPEGGE
jgi:hypothetical protein